MELDYGLMMQGIVNNIRARAPKVSGNLSRSIRYIAYKEGSTWGKLEIGTDYAQFVNYGYLQHPNSEKLESDYLFVEKGLKNELRNIVRKYGGGNVK